MWGKSLLILMAALGAPLAIWGHPSSISTIQLDDRSARNLQGVARELQEVVLEVYLTCGHPFVVLEGLRSPERQEKLLEDGKSTTLNSRHLTGHAIDFVPTSFDWDDIDEFTAIAECFKNHAGVEWGGDWETFKDYGHIQLQW